MGEYHISEYQFWNNMKNAKYAKLWEVFLIIFTLCHGQAAVERGFSINNELMVENMKEESLIASRFVYDTVKSSAVHFSEIRLNRRLKRNVRVVRMRYQLHLQDQRKLTVESEKDRKRKAIQDEIRAVESERKLSKESIASMSQEADALAVQAEKKHSFILLAKSNAFRQKMHESESNEQSLCEQARTLKEKLKFME